MSISALWAKKSKENAYWLPLDAHLKDTADGISQYSRVDGKISVLLQIFDVFHVVREGIENS